MIRLAVFGHPVTHSLSPGIHTRFAQQCGLEIEYRAIDCLQQDLNQKLSELIAAGGRGCNITVPLKHEAWELAHRHSDSALQARAANTLVFESVNNWYADNTDGRGLINDITRNLETDICGAGICLVGAGGAAAGVLGDLMEQGPSRLVIANRTVEKAQNLAGRFAGVQACALNHLDAQAPFNLVINATSLGHSGRHAALPTSMFAPGALCYDMNYGPAARPLADYCYEAGISYQSGLGMLVEQAALSFQLWTSETPDTQPVLEALTAI